MEHATDSLVKRAPDRVPTTADKDGRGADRRHIVEGILWVIGVIMLATLGFLVHTHPAPWPFELAVTRAIQGPHAVPCIYSRQPHSLANTWIDILSSLNDPLPAIVVPALWVGGMLLFRWFRQAIFLGAAVFSAATLFAVLTILVGRPRPGLQYGICVHDLIPIHSFPSGHVIHDMVYYGFLLYLSFTKPVREWRYHWVLLPLQVFAVLDLLIIGYARLFAGEHWLLDVTGGYLAGALWLFLFIFLYRWAGNLLEGHHAKKAAGKRAVATGTK